MHKNNIIDKKKKQNEYKTIRKIFTNNNIEESESPDFIMDKTIGVEITSFYHSQASATLHNSRKFYEYGQKERKYKNPEFNKEIKSWVTIEVHDDKSNSISKSNPMPLITNHTENIKNVILDKNAITYYGYFEKLYLIIDDKEDIFFFQDTKEQFPQIILKNSCKEILESKFDKIFFISRCLPGSNFFEFKKSIFYTLCRVFEEYYIGYFKIKYLNWNNIIINFKNYCEHYGLNTLNFSYDNNKIIFNDYSYNLFDKCNIDYTKCKKNNILINKEFIEYTYKECRKIKGIHNFL